MSKKVQVTKTNYITKKKLTRSLVLESWSDGQETKYIMSGDLDAIRELSVSGYVFSGVHHAIAKVTESAFIDIAEIYLTEGEEND